MNNVRPFVIKRNDTLPSLSIKVLARGEFNQVIPFDLSQVTGCTFSMSDNFGNLKISDSPAQITSASGGTIQYDWNAQDTDTEGEYRGEFELLFGSGQKMTVPTPGFINIHIVSDINGS